MSESVSSQSAPLLSPATPSSSTDTLASIPCNICRRQFSKYTCPKCNVPYCSLTCFRSEVHSACSESFYKNELETQIKTEPSKSAEERRKMMDMLKRFEEESADDAIALENEEDEDELAGRLENVDLDSASYDDLWSALTPAERDRFMRALGDPSSELAQQLLASEELEIHIVEPWWEGLSDRDAGDVSSGVQRERTAVHERRFGSRPSPLSVPPALMNAPAVTSVSGPSLLYNITAVLVAYAYITRHFSTSPLSELQDPDRNDARRIFSELVPFLTDKKSKTILPTLSGMITDIWSRFEPGTVTAKSLATLLRDASKLVRPHLVTTLLDDSETKSPVIDSAGSGQLQHVDNDTTAALGDIAALFSTRDTHTPIPKEIHVSHKLAFYAARVISTPTPVLHMLGQELATKAAALERQAMDTPGKSTAQRSQLIIDDEEPRRKVQAASSSAVHHAFIEELP